MKRHNVLAACRAPLLAVFIYAAISIMAWQFRNPTMNGTQWMLNLMEVISWR